MSATTGPSVSLTIVRAIEPASSRPPIPSTVHPSSNTTIVPIGEGSGAGVADRVTSGEPVPLVAGPLPGDAGSDEEHPAAMASTSAGTTARVRLLLLLTVPRSPRP
jgi:hypothetical protein